jgi:hypothetical protein
MNTQTDTSLPQHTALQADLSRQTSDKLRRVEVPTVEDDDDENESPYDGADALQNMWQRNSY